MKKTIIVIGLALVAVVSLVAAYGPWHEDMESVMEDGSYQDLVDYRESTGYNVMPWVDSQDDFESMQEMHEQMEEFHEQGYGMRGYGGYRSGGCPMWH